jgi:hypothetical protein
LSERHSRSMNTLSIQRPRPSIEILTPVAASVPDGRAPTFLMITGYEQARSIAADIAGDKEAAERVELELPETGVCTRGGVEGAAASPGCCGGPAPAEVTACCGDDAAAKAADKSGCACS